MPRLASSFEAPPPPPAALRELLLEKLPSRAAATARGDVMGLRLGDRSGETIGERARDPPGGGLAGHRSSASAAGEA
jgi:hypothetical protein